MQLVFWKIKRCFETTLQKCAKEGVSEAAQTPRHWAQQSGSQLTLKLHNTDSVLFILKRTPCVRISTTSSTQCYHYFLPISTIFLCPFAKFYRTVTTLKVWAWQLVTTSATKWATRRGHHDLEVAARWCSSPKWRKPRANCGCSSSSPVNSSPLLTVTNSPRQTSTATGTSFIPILFSISYS